MKDNKPNGSLLSPEFREIVKRLKGKDPELEALAGLDDKQESEERVQADEREKPSKNAG